MNQVPRAIIIGAGISGLALGWFLKRRFSDALSLTILESADRCGGWIRTRQQDGFLFEEGPRSCRVTAEGVTTIRLAEELGIADKVIMGSIEAKKRYLYVDGKLHPVPNHLLAFMRSPLMKGVLSSLWKEWREEPSSLTDESIADFVGRRFGGKIADNFVDPLVSGIYAGDMHKLSVRSCFPKWYEQEQQHGSLLKGALKSAFASKPETKISKQGSIFSFKQGMETLTAALYDRLKGYVRLGCPACEIRIRQECIEVKLSTGDILEGEHVYIATPAQAAARLVEQEAPLIAQEMAQTPYATIAAVNMGWKNDVLPYQGFGYLVPFNQHQEILGTVFDSSVFPEQNKGPQTRLTIMIGGIRHPKAMHGTTHELQAIAGKAVFRHLGISAEPDVSHVSFARHAIPQYEVGHHARLQRIEKELQQIFSFRLKLLGSAWRGVAVNDCISEAQAMAQGFGLDPKNRLS